MILYEAPHRLPDTLQELSEALGSQRNVTLCRELTKLHEEIRRTTLGEAVDYYRENAPRGEFVLILAGSDLPSEEQQTWSMEDSLASVRSLRERGMGLKDAVRQVSREHGVPKNTLYDAALSMEP